MSDDVIIITGTIEIDPGAIDLARSAFAAMAESSRSDTGCVTYGFWADPHDPCRFRAYVEWDSEESIREHMTTPHAAAFIEALPKLGIRSTDVWRDRATRTSQVG